MIDPKLELRLKDVAERLKTTVDRLSLIRPHDDRAELELEVASAMLDSEHDDGYPEGVLQDFLMDLLEKLHQ